VGKGDPHGHNSNGRRESVRGQGTWTPPSPPLKSQGILTQLSYCHHKDKPEGAMNKNRYRATKKQKEKKAKETNFH